MKGTHIVVGEVYDWHDVHNEYCPQNGDRYLEMNCTCPAPRKRIFETINRACVKKRLLEETNARSPIRKFTQVSKATLDAIQEMVKREIIRRAENPPRTGRTV